MSAVQYYEPVSFCMLTAWGLDCLAKGK